MLRAERGHLWTPVHTHHPQPTDEEVQGFTNLPIIETFSDVAGGLHDAVRGCLVNDTNHEKFCGAVALDTGDPGIRVVRAESSHQPWPNETPATLFFASPNGKIQVAERLIIGRKAHGSHLTFEEKRGVPMPLLFTGLTPYFAYSILYDPEHGTVGFKPRPVTTDGPQPVAVN